MVRGSTVSNGLQKYWAGSTSRPKPDQPLSRTGTMRDGVRAPSMLDRDCDSAQGTWQVKSARDVRPELTVAAMDSWHGISTE